MANSNSTPQRSTGRGPGGRGPGAGAAPVEKPKSFGKTMGRILKAICYSKIRVVIVLIFLVVSAACSAYAPKALGSATNVLFEGIVSQQVTQMIDKMPEAAKQQLLNGSTGAGAADIPSSVTDGFDFNPANNADNESSDTETGLAQEKPATSPTENPGVPASEDGAQADSAEPKATGEDTQNAEDPTVPTIDDSEDASEVPTVDDSADPSATADADAPAADADADASQAEQGGEEAGQNLIESPEDQATFEPAPQSDTEKVVALLKAAGQDQMAEMIAPMNITIGGDVDFPYFAWLLLVVAMFYVGSFATRWVAGWCSVRLITMSAKKLRSQIEEKLWRLPLSYYDKTSRGEIMSRTTNDLDNLTQVLNQTGGDLLYLSMMVFGVLVMMFWTSWLLALVAIATLPIAFGAIGLVMKRSQPAFKAQWGETGKLNGLVEEAFTGHNVISAFGRRDKFDADFKVVNDKLYQASFKAQFLSGLMMPIMTFMTNINYVVVALVGALRIVTGQMSLGDVQAFIQYTRQYSQPLGQLSQMVNQLQSGAASAERIYEILDAEEQPFEEPVSSEKASEILKGKVEFKDVSFSYVPEKPLIEGLNLTVEPGQTVAIVGPTGAGKTTLVNLLMRFYDVNSGSILFDDVDSKDLTREYIRQNVGMVLQDTWLFNGTIKENLEYGAKIGKKVTREEFEEATKATYVDHFVKGLPEGYQTELTTDANEVSVGEKQLLTICRAFLSEPNILILDEATSSVDTRTEVQIQKAMNKLTAGRTSFVIAHRLSTIRDADIILVMENGSIVEQGSHTELLKKKDGHYKALYEAQFEKAEVEEETNEPAR